MKYKTEVIIGIFIILLTTSVSAFTFFAQPDATQGKDCWLQDGFPNRNFGVDNLLEIKGNDNRRTLIEFDISSIPSNAIINSATLELYLVNKGLVDSINASIQRITHEWTEGTGNGAVTEDGATWNTYNGTNNWDISGGDFDSYIWTITEVSSTNNWYSYDLTNLVQSWVNNTYENYGMIIRNMRENSGEWKFASSDNTNSSIYPKLSITYTIPDTTPPSSVTNLQNQSNGLDFIYWTWTNPTDPDYLKNIIYLNNVNILNTTNNFYNATNLLEDTEYTIKIHTIDINNNINNTDVTNTARTLKSPCIENWDCTEWNECINNSQTRVCTDLNSCGTELNKPEESQNCTIENPNPGGGSGGGGGGSAPSTAYQTEATIPSTPKVAETKAETITESNLNNKQPAVEKSEEKITSSIIKEPSFIASNLAYIITSIIIVILAIFIYRNEVKDL